jgi:hypothetical protein
VLLIVAAAFPASVASAAPVSVSGAFHFLVRHT